jgi:DNA-binding NarL/FixJ family response regulator
MRTVLLVDDHALFRESLALLLRQRLPALRVLEAGSLHLAVRQCERHPGIDLIVLDLMLRDSRGVLTLERLRRVCPGTAVVVVSGATETGLALALRRLGAWAFLPKEVGSEALLALMRRVLLLPEAVADRCEPLSTRQREVLECMIEGKSNKAIGRELDLSEATVKTHVQAIFRKLEVNTRTQAVMAAIHLGLHDPGAAVLASGGPLE